MTTAAFRDDAVTVRVPASSGNVGPGFDALGLALGLYDEIEVCLAPSGLTVEVTGEGAHTVARDESNLVVRALRAALDHLPGGQPPGLRVRCTNRIPHGRGLGSSSAAVVAGMAAGRALCRQGEEVFDNDAMLTLATELEGHPDNAAASLLGGLTVAWTDGAGAHAVRLEPLPLTPVVFVPDEPLSTEAARGLLPPTVPHADASANAGRAALLVAALTGAAPRLSGADLGLLLTATEDRLHQSYRAPAMPRSVALVTALRDRGVPAVVSGAGPTVLAFAQVSGTDALVAAAPADFDARVLTLDREGVRTMVGRTGNPTWHEDVGRGGETGTGRFC